MAMPKQRRFYTETVITDWFTLNCLHMKFKRSLKTEIKYYKSLIHYLDAPLSYLRIPRL